MGQQNTKSNLFLKVTLGQTQSHQLFDFQSGGFQQQEQLLKSPSFIIDKGETVDFIPEQQFAKSNNPHPDSPIYKVTLDDLQQITIKDMGRAESHVLWKVIKPGDSQVVRPGDVLKIGKIRLELKRIVEKRQENQYEQETVKDYAQDHANNDQLQSVHSNHSNLDRCRICFSSYSKKNDPLLCLCKCSGSIKYIHFMCLKDWISNNFSKREDQHCKFYTYQQTCCQLCKHQLPNEFTHEGKSYSFLDFTTFQPPYAEFEYNQVQNNKKKFYRYIISLQKDKQVLIGRNNISHVVMKDISISRTHCSLQYTHGMLIVRDKKSKFGTLVKVDKEVEFSSETGLQLQFDSKIIELYSSGAFKGCCKDVDSYRLKYERVGGEEGGEGGEGWGVNGTNDRIEHPNNNNPTRFTLAASQSNNRQHNTSISETRNNIIIIGSGLPPSPSHRQIEHRNTQMVIRESGRQSEVDNNRHSHNGSNRAIEEGLNMQEDQRGEGEGRAGTNRGTMVRETMARDEAVRY